ncbi:MAG: RNA polymerase sigma factor, partial [Planctomycetaceae bacterium]
MTVTVPPPPAPKPIESLADRELVSRYVRLRDEIAFATLVRRHSSLVLGVCQRVLRHRQDVEDAFQATFLVLARDAHRVRKRAALASWLHGVAYRTSLRAAESRHRRIRLLEDVAMLEDNGNSLADVAARHERQLLDEELQELPDKYRAPLVLHYLEGKTAKQVADDLKLSVSTVEGRLKRGRKELQLRLARRGIGLSVALAALSLTPSVVTAAELHALVGGTIHAGLSYTAGDPAGPLFTHEAASLAAKETIAMTTTTATATLTAALLVPLALSVANHESPDAHAERQAPIIATTQLASAGLEPIRIAQIEQSERTPVLDTSSVDFQPTERSAEELRIEQALTEPISLH